MAYDSSNPPALIFGRMNAPRRSWQYESSDPATTVDNSGYFTNAFALGIKDGDFMLVYDTVNKIWTGHVAIMAGAVCNLSNGITLASNASNTD